MNYLIRKNIAVVVFLTIVVFAVFNVVTEGSSKLSEISADDSLFKTSAKRKSSTYQDKLDESIKSLVVSYQKDKDNYYVNIRLGYLYMQKKSYSNAKYHYKNALRARKDSIEARLGLYGVYAAQKKFRTAEKYCKSVVKMDPYNYYGNLYLMICFTVNHNFKDAEEIGEKMLKRYPSDMSFLNQLSYVYSRQRKLKEYQQIEALKRQLK